MSARNRWVTFDCFGTLIDWNKGFTEILTPFAGDRVNDVVRAYHECERRIELERPLRTYKTVLVDGVVAAGKQAGVEISRAQASTLPESWHRLRPFADVETLLAELRRRGYRLAVLTNCDDDLFERTHRTFRVPFDLIVTAERVRGYKPARWHFRAFEMLARVARPPSVSPAARSERGAVEWVHVASSWYHDIVPAKALGIRHVWLDRERSGGSAALPSSRVHTVADTVQAIDDLFEHEPCGVAC